MLAALWLASCTCGRGMDIARDGAHGRGRPRDRHRSGLLARETAPPGDAARSLLGTLTCAAGFALIVAAVAAGRGGLCAHCAASGGAARRDLVRRVPVAPAADPRPRRGRPALPEASRREWRPCSGRRSCSPGPAGNSSNGLLCAGLSGRTPVRRHGRRRATDGSDPAPAGALCLALMQAGIESAAARRRAPCRGRCARGAHDRLGVKDAVARLGPGPPTTRW